MENTLSEFAEDDQQELKEIEYSIRLGKAINTLRSNPDFQLLEEHLTKTLPNNEFIRLHTIANDEIERNNALNLLTALSLFRNILDNAYDDSIDKEERKRQLLGQN